MSPGDSCLKRPAIFAELSAGKGAELPGKGHSYPVIPAQAGIQRYARKRGKRVKSPRTRLYDWVPACAGMTVAEAADGVARSSGSRST